jgi:hypothetical protein
MAYWRLAISVCTAEKREITRKCATNTGKRFFRFSLTLGGCNADNANVLLGGGGEDIAVVQ